MILFITTNSKLKSKFRISYCVSKLCTWPSLRICAFGICSMAILAFEKYEDLPSFFAKGEIRGTREGRRRSTIFIEFYILRKLFAKWFSPMQTCGPCLIFAHVIWAAWKHVTQPINFGCVLACSEAWLLMLEGLLNQYTPVAHTQLDSWKDVPYTTRVHIYAGLRNQALVRQCLTNVFSMYTLAL